jgi:hypothetical protein
MSPLCSGVIAEKIIVRIPSDDQPVSNNAIAPYGRGLVDPACQRLECLRPVAADVLWLEHGARDSGSPLARPHFATRRIGLKHRLVEAADAWQNWSAISVYLKQSPSKIGELLLGEHRVVE